MFGKRRKKRRGSAGRCTHLGFEQFERREVLSGNGLVFETLNSSDKHPVEPIVLEAAPGLYVPKSAAERRIADKVGFEMAWLHADWLDYERAGGVAIGPFESFSTALRRQSFVVQDDRVAIEAFAFHSAAAIREALLSIGFHELASVGRGISGWLPFDSISELAATAGLNFARVSYGGVNSAGATNSQGDAAQRSDDARSTFSVDGAGVTVGVISDSYDTSHQINPNLLTRAANDVASGDLPTGINVLDDTLPLNRNPIDEGRAMLQIVHDVAPGASLAFHTAGTSPMAMSSAILDLQTAGSDVIVDDIVFLIEPMFQDGVIAQAVDEVVADGVSYFSAAGNQSRLSYQGGFNPAGLVTLDGRLERAHQFVNGDSFQRVTIPNNATFRVSFQWDSPFASAGGLGSTNDLNIYLISGGTIWDFSIDNNIGGDAVEVLEFFNDVNFTGTTLFDILITGVAGPVPGTIKYVDFSRQNNLGQNVVYNEHLNNSTTLFGKANAEGAIAVGAAFYGSTPEFGQSPPLVENFSALAGTPILFNTAGIRLPTPVIRQKTDVVGPDGANTTFFGADIVQDADAFPNFFGTSAAAPHVAGLAALMLDAVPTLKPAAIEAAQNRGGCIAPHCPAFSCVACRTFLAPSNFFVVL